MIDCNKCLLSKETIWKVQQGNSYWKDAEKGKAVAQAQLAKILEKVERIENPYREGGSKDKNPTPCCFLPECAWNEALVQVKKILGGDE